MKKKSRILAILVTVMMVVAMMPMTAGTVFAATEVVNDSAALLNAISNASTDPDDPTVIQLGADIEYSTNEINVSSGRYIKLDLGGKTLRIAAIKIYGNLTVEGTGSLIGVNNAYNPIYVKSNGEFTLSGGNLTATSASTMVMLQDNGKFVMTGGEINGTGLVAVWSTSETNVVEIGGGTITDSFSAGSVCIRGTASITGGTIINTNSTGAAVYVFNNGSVTVNGGTLQNTNGGYSLNIQDGGQTTQTGGTLSGSINTNSSGSYIQTGGTNPYNRTITFDSNGGSALSPATATTLTTADGEKISSLPTPERAGHDFKGWFTAETGGEEVTTATVFTSDTTIYAQWEEKGKESYTVTFKVKNGLWNDGAQEDKSVTLSRYVDEDKLLVLQPEDIPAVGNKPANGYETGSWDVTPNTDTAISKDTTYTYTYVKKDDPTPTPAKVSGTLLAKLTAKGKSSLVLTWNKVNGAEGYDIFFIKCGKQAPKKVKTIKGNKTFKWTKTGLKKKTAYKACVKAWVMKDGKKTYVRTSPIVHAYTSGSTKNYTNSKSVTVKKTSVTLKKGKTYKIKATVNKLKKGKKLMPTSHAAKLRYKSSDTKVATVSSSGKITAKNKGTCYVYVYAVNGAYKKVKVTVN